ncbi:hypothetical protein ME7_01188, partial [Bartonella birtlesii LL-WM9]
NEKGETDYTNVTFGGKEKGLTALHNVADGNISSGSTDAIAGGQLYSLNSTISTYLGGGTKYENGVWTAPDFKVQKFNKDGNTEEQIYHNVADAFAEVSTSITAVHNEVNNQISQVVSDSLVKQEKETDRITIGKEVLGTEINISDKNKGDRILSGVKTAVNDNEAVNKAQLDQSLEKLSNSLQSEDSAVVLYDKKDGKIDYTSVTFGKGPNAAPVALHNVADGTIAKGSHDVINGNQINTLSQDVAKFLGGDTGFDKGVFTGPSYKLSEVSKEGKVTDKSFTDVGGAFVGLDENIKNVNQRIKEVSQGVAQDSLSWSKADNAFSAQHGEGEERKASKITHILAGNIASGSTDAVTGGQLYTMNEQLGTYFGGGAGYNKEGGWVAPNFKVNTVSKDGSQVEEQSYDNVAQAFEGVGNSFTNIHNEVTNAVTDINNHINNIVSDSLVKQDDTTKVIKIGAEKGGTSINIANSGDAARTLSG